MLVRHFYKLSMDLITLTEVCVCVFLSLMPQVVLDIFALWLINYRPVGPRKEQTNGQASPFNGPEIVPALSCVCVCVSSCIIDAPLPPPQFSEQPRNSSKHPPPLLVV